MGEAPGTEGAQLLIQDAVPVALPPHPRHVLCPDVDLLDRAPVAPDAVEVGAVRHTLPAPAVRLAALDELRADDPRQRLCGIAGDLGRGRADPFGAEEFRMGGRNAGGIHRRYGVSAAQEDLPVERPVTP